MSKELVIESINIAGATLLINFFILVILFIGIFIINGEIESIDTSKKIDEEKRNIHQIRLSPVIWGFILTFPALFISESMFKIWQPLFQGLSIPTVSTHNSVFYVFIINLILASYLVWRSGGVQNSPFTSVLFTIPALAIFLRLQPYVFIICTAYVACIYLFTLYGFSDKKSLNAKHANAVVNILCLILTTFTGYITMPVPLGMQ